MHQISTVDWIIFLQDLAAAIDARRDAGRKLEPKRQTADYLRAAAAHFDSLHDEQRRQTLELDRLRADVARLKEYCDELERVGVRT